MTLIELGIKVDNMLDSLASPRLQEITYGVAGLVFMSLEVGDTAS